MDGKITIASKVVCCVRVSIGDLVISLFLPMTLVLKIVIYYLKQFSFKDLANTAHFLNSTIVYEMVLISSRNKKADKSHCPTSPESQIK